LKAFQKKLCSDISDDCNHPRLLMIFQIAPVIFQTILHDDIPDDFGWFKVELPFVSKTFR